MRHDELNRLKDIIYPSGKRIDYSYDEVGNLHTITTSFGLVSYDYDAYNRLARITLPNLNVIDYHYDENNYKGNLTSIHYPNGTYTTFDYDNRSRMTGLTNNRPGGIISQYTYTLDGVGNRTNVSFQEPLSWTLPPGTVGYGYLPGNFLNSAGTTTYSYDPNGNLYTRTQGGNTTTYTFDSQDRLTNISSPSLNIQYQYDGLFNRVSMTGAGATTKYLIDPNGFLPQVIAEMDAAYNITGYYVYDGIGLVAKMSGSNVYYYHYNGSGNTIATTDASGNMVNKYAYDEFGNLMNVQESVANPFLFVGQYGVMDDDSGLLYMRARYYDPQVGRFINKDPVGYWGGPNLFTYAASNPVNYFDPIGLDVVIVINRTSQTYSGTFGAFSVINTSDPSFMYTGQTLEPPSGGTNPKILAGTYPGYQRCASGPKTYNPPRIQLVGAISETGASMPGAQLHIGTIPSQTTGCVLMGAPLVLKWINAIVNTDRGRNITVIIYDPPK